MMNISKILAARRRSNSPPRSFMVCYVGMVYGPVGAFLAEFFPGRIRYCMSP